jgi:hypothetical protein
MQSQAMQITVGYKPLNRKVEETKGGKQIGSENKSICSQLYRKNESKTVYINQTNSDESQLVKSSTALLRQEHQHQQ